MTQKESDDLNQWNQDNTGVYAEGATFGSDGQFSGKVHGTEEIIPRATTSKGAGPISQALAELYAMRSGSSVVQSSSNQPVVIHIAELMHVDKIDANTDICDIVSKVRGGLEHLNMRSIGYQRGGSCGR
jgi:hypothetical protein